ncbi:MAG: bifunctional (p)ppGpp synthetase/guanosine-3',5'-bis(diphosphate) 3'-pyrophosphohydrolase [Proteobacteria bacterium]|nr:bifunctional (p)ppGpp synthetase/guanosine-3',5'-bis(diphosphate) 3'-pyrophosphohydrolase [Pseudomonadota bacterium]NLN62587.1 bifunctional (p)ppGpp synthetase/guanosine-3',5'-bis(diphosphate) 3'-pyrophosphohydrolase [Myxococcales bacterium]
MALLEHILLSFWHHHPDGDTTLIKRAWDFAHAQHEGQLRKSGEPYVVHPMSVAKIVADMGLCVPSICAALLHDVIEDTETTREQIDEMFGEEVSLLVDGVTKLDKVQFSHSEERQAESFRKMLIATVSDIRVLLIKLADRLHNMSTLDPMPQEKRERIAQETRDIYVPLANRLGLSWLKADLDDLSFKYLEPDDYQELARQVRSTQQANTLFIDRVKREITNILAQNELPGKVSGRVKNLYSIYTKMKRKNLEFEQVHDAIAFRVITDTVGNCYGIFGLVHARWMPVPGRIKDYIAMPKPNHYQSLHTTVVGLDGERMEIQIRTLEMNQVAEYGIASHWAYKENTRYTEGDLYNWFREIIDSQEGTESSREFLDSVKGDLHHGEIFVFTPAGEVKNLTQGATALDFAYAIHSEVGNHCVGARINGVQVPLKTPLKSGDNVEILTSKNQKPSLAWLDYVTTTRARTRIRAELRSEQHQQSLKLGRTMLEKALRRHGISFNRVYRSGKLGEVVSKFKAHSADDLIANIGFGKTDEHDVALALLPQEKRDSVPADIRESPFEKIIRKTQRVDSGIIIDGMDNMLVHFPECCHPLPGEPIEGYISRGRGLIIHTRDCPQAAALESERRVRVHWDAQAIATRPVTVRVVSNDKPGILASLTNVFQRKSINITGANCAAENNLASCLFTFEVKNLDQLNDIIKSLRATSGVNDVVRIKRHARAKQHSG